MNAVKTAILLSTLPIFMMSSGFGAENVLRLFKEEVK
jgi:hypothetical protein